MSYEQFKTNIIIELKKYFPQDITFSINRILKYNKVWIDGLNIFAPKTTVSPTFYLQDYYVLYKSGFTLKQISKNILNIYGENDSLTGIKSNYFTDYAKIKERIVFQIIHYAQNRELLSDIPHIPYHDLAIIFYCLINHSANASATLLITNRHLHSWDISLELLYEQAAINTPFLLAPQLTELNHVFAPFLQDTKDTAKTTLYESMPFPMYVLTNSAKLNGAACIIYKDLLKDIAVKLQSSFYILPCSIHEVILVPAENKDYSELLTEMVVKANHNDIPGEEILSDHAYYYDRMKDEIL